MVAAAIFALWSVLNLLSANAAEVPQISHPVTDVAGVLSPQTEEEIARELVSHRESTGVQLAVLIVDTTHGRDIADYAQAVFDRWGGGSKERDDGALFVLAITDRRSRLHLGYGLEAVIPDAIAKRMLDDLRPWLKGKNYGGATLQLVRAVRARTDHLSPGEPIAPPLGAKRWLWPLILLVGVGLGIAWGMALARGWRSYKKQYKAWKHSKKSWLVRAGLACAGLARQRPVQIALGLLLLGQLVLALVLGDDHVTPYSVVYWSFMPAGWLIRATPKAVGITVGVLTSLGFVASVVLACSDHAAYADPSSLYGHILPTIGIYWLFTVMIVPAAISGVSGGGGSYSSSYSSSSSSRSYSSSSSRSSSSYSSSSYSGGGGSSGGGGASSSW